MLVFSASFLWSLNDIRVDEWFRFRNIMFVLTGTD